MIRPELVIFDCDGVVVDSEGPTQILIRDELAAHGLDLTVERVTDLFVGGSMSNVFETARRMGADLPDDWLETFYAALFEMLATRVTPIDGIGHALDCLDAAGIPFAIGSNGRPEKMETTLGTTGLLERFRGRMYSAQTIGKLKPAPDVYLQIAGEFGVDPSRCVVVEDSAPGATAAKAAQMHCLGFARETPAHKLAPIADQLFEDMRQLPDLLGISSAEG